MALLCSANTLCNHNQCHWAAESSQRCFNLRSFSWPFFEFILKFWKFLIFIHYGKSHQLWNISNTDQYQSQPTAMLWLRQPLLLQMAFTQCIYGVFAMILYWFNGVYCTYLQNLRKCQKMECSAFYLMNGMYLRWMCHSCIGRMFTCEESIEMMFRREGKVLN